MTLTTTVHIGVTNQEGMSGVIDENCKEVLPCEYRKVDTGNANGAFRVIKRINANTYVFGSFYIEDGNYVIKWRNGDVEVIGKA